jgi:hypothetical protein
MMSQVTNTMGVVARPGPLFPFSLVLSLVRKGIRVVLKKRSLNRRDHA